MSGKAATVISQPFSLLGGISILMVLNGLIQLPELLANMLAVWEAFTQPFRTLFVPLSDLISDLLGFNLPNWWLDYTLVGMVSAGGFARTSLVLLGLKYFLNKDLFLLPFIVIIWPFAVFAAFAQFLRTLWRISQIRSLERATRPRIRIESRTTSSRIPIVNIETHMLMPSHLFFGSFLYAALISILFWLPDQIGGLDWPFGVTGG